MTIAEFLLARIAEDEAAARETAPGTHFADGPGDYYRASQDNGIGYVWTTRARVLAECAAKRAIVEKRLAIGLPDRPIGDGQAWLSGAHEAVDAERGHILRTLAAVYADHPDYRHEWGAE